MKKFIAALVATVLLLSLTACGQQGQQKPSAEEPKKDRTMILSTTTSTADTGLLDYLLPIFKSETGIEVKYIAKGTGEAIKMGERGDADCLLVHAKAQEEKFVQDGFGVERFDVMYNDFILVGPKEDPAKLKEKSPNDIVKAFKTISESKASFISRGDESGTHTKEKGLWKEAAVNPAGDWYISAGKGMGAVLQMADEKRAYTLTDRGTYLSMKDKLGLDIVTEKGDKLYNQYGVIAVNPKKYSTIKIKESEEFIKWILSEKGQKLIGEYGKDKYGQSLFFPNAKK